MIYSIFLKATLFISFASVVSLLANYELSDPLLILNMENQAAFPRNFRLSTFPMKEETTPLPSSQGLVELRASASGQFSEKSFAKMLEVIPEKKILMFDLRQESHGYVDGIAVSWYGKRDWGNVGKSLKEIIFDEEQKLECLRKEQSLVIHDAMNPFVVNANSIFNENELASKYEIQYVRLPVTDHVKPDDEMVDRFLKLIENDCQESWIHFHCSAGRGRATTFMCLYDILKNGKDVSFHDILMRQSLIGGKCLLKFPSPTAWKYGFAVERTEFLKEFYQFINERSQHESWSDWKIKRLNFY